MDRIPAVSIVVPTLNEEKYLPLLLESLAPIDAPKEVIVVDGQSTDGTRDVVSRFSSRFIGDSSLVCIESQTRGTSAQRNLGAEHARHDVLLFLDADVLVPSPEAYRHVIATFVAKKYSIASTTVKPIGFDLPASLIYMAGTLFQVFMLAVCRRAFFSGFCMLVRKDAFTQVGGFDVALRVGEDNDFSYRVSRIGRSGLIRMPILVSSRRFKKYGYWSTYGKWSYGTILGLFGNFRRAQHIPYRFGEFADEVQYNKPNEKV